MKVVIDPAWSLMRTLEAAFEAYIGSGNTSRGLRMSVLMVWANVVGRRRAMRDLAALRDAAAGWQQVAEQIGVSASTLRKVRKHFAAVPDHAVIPAAEADDDMTTLREFTLLGRGGYGEVWKAKDALDRTVAVKYMTTATTEAQKAVLAHAAPLAVLGPRVRAARAYGIWSRKHTGRESGSPG
jgi:hypothetical protein